MKMKRILIILLIVGVSASLFAQETAPDPTEIGIDSAQQNLQEISVDRFEDPGFWQAHIPLDKGIVTHRRVQGGPADKEPIPGEENAGIDFTDENVIGIKVDYYRRGPISISLEPSRPLSVPGIVKTISVWVVGRNFNHRLNLVIEDYYGNVNILPMGALNFSGWKQLTVAVPPTIRQRNPHYNVETGIKILGFVIDAAIEETYGTYYVYFDDLRAVTDLFGEESRDSDDMVDNW